MNDDLPARLRAMAGPIEPNVCTEAAEAIKTLTAERDEARRELKVMTEEHRLACEDRDLIQRERDEARREACKFESKVDWDHGNIDPARFSPMALAAERGWDCFKEDGK